MSLEREKGKRTLGLLEARKGLSKDISAEPLKTSFAVRDQGPLDRGVRAPRLAVAGALSQRVEFDQGTSAGRKRDVPVGIMAALIIAAVIVVTTIFRGKMFAGFSGIAVKSFGTALAVKIGLPFFIMIAAFALIFWLVNVFGRGGRR